MKNTAVGELLASTRHAAGISVRTLAPQIRKADGSVITASYITDIEKGRGVPSDFVAIEFARFFKQSPQRWLEACSLSRETRKES